MQDRTTIVRQLVASKDPILADRVDAKIGKAEHDVEFSKGELARAAAAEAKAKENYAELQGLTSSIKSLAPLIREELGSLERLWRGAAEKRLKLKDTLELVTKELASVCRARDQLKQIGLYHPSL
jgi:chromosome segregation ATPase